MTASDCKLLQDDLDQLFKWSTDWCQPFNQAKCKCLRISLSSSKLIPFTYCINGSTVDSVPHYRNIGVHFSNELSWTYHHSSIISKAYNILYFCRRTKKMSPHHSSATKLSLYISLVWSNLPYCPQVWRPHLLKYIRSIERVQCRSTKFILNDYASNYKSRLINLNLLLLSL